MSQPTQGRSSTSGIKWFLAISGVLFAAVALGYSIYQGQFVSSITPTEIIFGQKTVPESEVRDAQSDVRANLDQLEEQVAEAPLDEQVTQFGGVWQGGDGNTYQIAQAGAQAVISIDTAYGVAMYGTGTVQNGVFAFTYQTANGVTGQGSLTLQSARELRGTFTSAYGTAHAVMTR